MLKKIIKTKDKADNSNENSAPDKIKQVLDEQWSKIESFIIKNASDIAVDKLHDDNFMEIIFLKTYEMLPTVVRLVVSREKFLVFMKTKQEPLKHRLISIQQEKEKATQAL